MACAVLVLSPEWRSFPAPFDGPFWLTDGLALGALREPAAAGFRVLHDAAVIGFDSSTRAGTPSRR